MARHARLAGCQLQICQPGTGTAPAAFNLSGTGTALPKHKELGSAAFIKTLRGSDFPELQTTLGQGVVKSTIKGVPDNLRLSSASLTLHPLGRSNEWCNIFTAVAGAARWQARDALRTSISSLQGGRFAAVSPRQVITCARFLTSAIPCSREYSLTCNRQQTCPWQAGKKLACHMKTRCWGCTG